MSNLQRVLITGATGLLGYALVEYFKDYYEVYATYLNHYIKLKSGKLIKADLRDNNATNKIIRDIKPKLIIHTAALTNVDYCEQHPEEAYDANVNATSYIVKACESYNCDLIHISTDFVFYGKKGNYKEVDKPNPINVHGKTKYEAEKLVQKSKINYLIIRAAIYGWNIQNKKCFPENVISNLRSNNPIKAYTVQLSTPIIVTNLARLIKTLYSKKSSGIFHVGCDEKASRYEFAMKIAREFSLDNRLIIPVNRGKIKQIAPRPHDVSLNNSKIKSFLNIKEISIEKDIKELKSTEQYVKSRKESA